MSRTLVGLALLFALAGTPAPAADLGVPRGGLDRVLLDDGRVVEAKVLPREGTVIPLEFPDGTLRVPRERIVEVREWKDFDPAPRDAAEEKKVAEGYVRWEGRLVPPERAKKEREDEVAEERTRREEEAAAHRWTSSEPREAGKFRVYSNADEDDVDFWCEGLKELGKAMAKTFRGRDESFREVVVFLYRDEASERVQKAKDDQVPYERYSYGGKQPHERVDVVLGEEDREDLMPVVFGLSAIRLLEAMAGWKTEELGMWVRCGVPLAYAGARYEKGSFDFGEVVDPLLVNYRALQRAGRLPPLEQVLQAGNSYWKGLSFRELVEGRCQTEFEKEQVPTMWLFVDFLIHAERGRYRGGLTNWLRFWLDSKIGSKRSEASGSWEDQKALLLKYMKCRDLETVAAAMEEYADGLEYRRAITHVRLAESALKDRRDKATALEHVEKAVALAAGDGADLRRAGEICAEVPGGAARALEILRAAVEADPLDPETHTALAKLLDGADAERERGLAASLGGVGDQK